ncbi:MAG: hypothetical protein ACK4RF_01765 [Cyclobacteriaceae bacterium]
MRYQTISEYFYKFFSVLFLIVLVPLGAFVYLYGAAQLGAVNHPLAGSDTSDFVVYGLAGICALDWIAATVYFSKSLRGIRTLVSLGDRLDRYYRLTITRFAWVGGGLLGLSVGFYLVGDQLLTALFMVSILVLGFVWPFPAKISRDLGLKESERRVLYDRK